MSSFREYVNRIIEYFEELDKKNFIMLVISVIIAAFTIVYYLNEMFTEKENKLLSKKRVILKELRKFNKSYVASIKRENKKLKLQIKSLNDDLKFLLSEIESSKLLIIDDKRFLKILHQYIKIGENVDASFEVNISKNLKKYNLSINGNFDALDFFRFVKFLKALESPNAIIVIDNLKLKEVPNIVNYDINLSIWSFK